MSKEQFICNITVTKNSHLISASGQSWLSDLSKDHVIKKNVSHEPSYVIAAVIDDNNAQLTVPYAGISGTFAFVIHRSFTPNYRLARLFPGDCGGAEILTRHVIDKIDTLLRAIDERYNLFELDKNGDIQPRE